jgi:predicted Zn-dependent protease
LLQREPDNPKLMSNLVTALERQGRQPEAARWRERLARLDPEPPFHFFDAGLVAMHAHQYARARELFARELRRDAYWHELHFWMARAELALGHAVEGRRHLEMARESSTTSRERALYAAKLDRLRALR